MREDRGHSPDHRGRFLVDILCRDDDWLEATHDYIQWLFPLPERSNYNAQAPLLDTAVIAEFAADADLRDALRASFIRMLSFYGLVERDGRVLAGANWNQRKHDWFTESTHNDLRITRILRSLCLLGLRDEARRFLAGLLERMATEPDSGIAEEAVGYWRSAVR
jgi:hypothetical protein